MVVLNRGFHLFTWIIIIIIPAILDVVTAADGGWSDWTDWDSCSESCGKGTRKRYRYCNNPLPSNGGRWCVGKPKNVTACEAILQCPVDGGWSEWSVWTACSVSCGEGVTNRFRDCDSPEPANGGQDCAGSPSELMTCFAVKDCPRDGKWSSWGQWSSCSVTCGSNGSTFRYRSCNNPAPKADGRPCDGLSQQNRKCHAPKKCAVNGQWSEWSEWSSCSVTCGSGVRNRWRRCDNPPPQNGGLDCSRKDAGEMQETSCNGTVIFCPVNGNWSEWSEWGDCTTSECKNPRQLAYKFRERSCNNPHPAHKGNMCQGTFLSAGVCEGPVNCAVDGGWSEWSEWECTKFVAVRKRACNNPPPSKGGKTCKGDQIEQHTFEDEAYLEHCPDFEDRRNDDVVGDDEDMVEGSGKGLEENEDEDG